MPKQPKHKPPSRDTIDALVRIVGAGARDPRRGGDGALSRGVARPLSRQGGARAQARRHRRSLLDPQARQRDQDGDRAARRQYRPRRRSDPVRKRTRGGRLARAAQSRARHRPRLEHVDGRGGAYARASASRRRERGPAVPFEPCLGGKRANRRRARDQCRRHGGSRLWQRAGACARTRSRACRRRGVERAQILAQGQFGLRPQGPHRRVGGDARHHHGRGAPPLPQGRREGHLHGGLGRARNGARLFRARLGAGRPRPHRLRDPAAHRGRVRAAPRHGSARSLPLPPSMVRAVRAHDPARRRRACAARRIRSCQGPRSGRDRGCRRRNIARRRARRCGGCASS